VIAFRVNDTARELLHRASAAMGREVLNRLRGVMDRENELTVAHIQQARATGQGPFPVTENRLGVRTGRYRRSIRRSPARVIQGAVVSSIGSNLAYAGVHEFGFRGPVNVKPHTRQVASRNVRGTVDGKRKLVAKGLAFVRGHSRQVDVPARAPITTGIQDRAAAYSAAASEAVIDTLRGLR
jgi:hypothetical protein